MNEVDVIYGTTAEDSEKIDKWINNKKSIILMQPGELKPQAQTAYLTTVKKANDLHKLAKHTNMLAINAAYLADYQFAANQKKVNLIIPDLSKKLELDLQLTGLLAKQDKAILLSFSQLLNSKPAHRIRMLQNAKKLVKMCAKKKLPIKWASLAKKAIDIRNVRDLESVAVLLGDQKNNILTKEADKKLKKWLKK